MCFENHEFFHLDLFWGFFHMVDDPIPISRAFLPNISPNSSSSSHW